MAAHKGNTRPSVKEILSEHYWDSKREEGKRHWADTAKELGFATVGSVLTGSGIFFVPYMANIGQKLAQKIGFKCKKNVDKILPYEYSLTVLSIAVSLSEAKNKILGVEDTEYGSMIEAELPSDWRSFAGTLFFEIYEQGASLTKITGTSIIKGQLIDYGKGKKTGRIPYFLQSGACARREEGTAVSIGTNLRVTLPN